MCLLQELQPHHLPSIFNTLCTCRDPFFPGVCPASTGHSSSSLPLLNAHFSPSFIQKCHRDLKNLSTVQQNFQETGNIQHGCCSVWQPPTLRPSYVTIEFWKCSRSNCGTPLYILSHSELQESRVAGSYSIGPRRSTWWWHVFGLNWWPYLQSAYWTSTLSCPIGRHPLLFPYH